MTWVSTDVTVLFYLLPHMNKRMFLSSNSSLGTRGLFINFAFHNIGAITLASLHFLTVQGNIFAGKKEGEG